MADIVTQDGTFIPDRIRTVRGKLRQSNLTFPIQLRPSNHDIDQWQYLMDSISDKGMLHVPLGDWIRSPDQKFSYVINESKQLIYKRKNDGWVVFGKKQSNSRRYVKLRLHVDTVPRGCTPVVVIEATQYIILVTDYTARESIRTERKEMYIERQQQSVKNMLGRSVTDEQLMQELHNTWHTQDCEIVCATDGGLKGPIGTSSYAMYFPHISHQPIVFGNSAEYQPTETSSSTRQELLGQLGIEYWLSNMEKEWGRPRNGIKVNLITDSQSSIDIKENISASIGIKDVLKPDMDIALELYQQRQSHCTWVQWSVTKVESHIDQSEAPDTFFWECNDFVDALATKARMEFSITSLQQRESHVLSGTILKYYLMEKYTWSVGTFSSIDWKMHNKELQKFPRLKKVTLHKYIHGWLATQKRKLRERRALDDKCPLCGEVELRSHLFQCKNEQLQFVRTSYWKRLCTRITEHTVPEFRAIFQTGLDVIAGGELPTEQAKDEWPHDMQVTFQVQTEIGWDQVMFGRIATAWDVLAQYGTCIGKEHRVGVWAGKAIRLCWEHGLELWRTRNQLVHGSDTEVSAMEKVRVSALIKALYSELPIIVPQSQQLLFSMPEDEILNMEYTGQVAWLGHAKYVYPQQFKDIESRTAGIYQSRIEVDVLQMRETSTVTK